MIGSRAVVDPVVFEAQAPPAGAWASIAITLGLAGYWWLVFVPSERRCVSPQIATELAALLLDPPGFRSDRSARCLSPVAEILLRTRIRGG